MLAKSCVTSRKTTTMQRSNCSGRKADVVKETSVPCHPTYSMAFVETIESENLGLGLVSLAGSQNWSPCASTPVAVPFAWNRLRRGSKPYHEGTLYRISELLRAS